MADLPITRIPAPPETAHTIRQAVRAAGTMPGGGAIARLEDTSAFLGFLSDPAVYAPIYSLPRPLSEPSVRAFIADHLDQMRRGEGLLFVTRAADGTILSYSDIQVWPEWAAGELGGGMRADRQGQGQGSSGAAASFTWMFDTLGLDLICETAAPDNIRTAKLLDGLGFERKCEIESTRPDGTKRLSLVWEVTRTAWCELRHGG